MGDFTWEQLLNNPLYCFITLVALSIFIALAYACYLDIKDIRDGDSNDQ